MGHTQAAMAQEERTMSEYTVVFRELFETDAGRGLLLNMAIFPVSWFQYALGEFLKTYAPKILHSKIPGVLLGVGTTLGLLLVVPLRGIGVFVEPSEVMLLAGAGTLGAKMVHDTGKIKKMENGGEG